ncbi:MAG: hypothetical protein ABI606_16420, partial [Rhodoferax sp.]
LAAIKQLGSTLGISDAAVNAAVEKPMNIDRIDLKGLTMQEQKEKISAVIGNALSTIAQDMAPQFKGFVKGGEEYLYTLTRVAAGMEEAAFYTDKLGLQEVALTDLKNKQGDVGAELVRQSITSYEALSGVGNIVENFSGSAGDIAALYSGLVDVRTSLVTLGFSAGVVTADLLKGAGGLDALQSGLSDFATGFLTTGEQTALKQAKMDTEFAKLGMTTPATAEGFKQLVLGLQAGGVGSAELLGRVIVLSGGMRDLADSTADASKAILDTATTAANAAMGALEKAVKAEKDKVTAAYSEQSKAVQSSLDAMSGSVGKLQSLASSLKSTLDGMRISGSDGAYRASAQAEISAALAIARAGGPLPLDGQITSALATVSKPSEQFYKTFADYARDFYATANDIGALNDLTGAQLTAQQITQGLLKDQLATLKTTYDGEVKRLDEIVTTAQAALDAANGNISATLSVVDAVNAVNASLLLLVAERASQNLPTTAPSSAGSGVVTVGGGGGSGVGGAATDPYKLPGY